MIASTPVTLVECDGVQYESCAFVASTAASVSEDGNTMVSKVTAIFHEILPAHARYLVVDEVQYTVLAIKKVTSACITKVEAFRTMLIGCDACDGVILTSLIVEDCDEDSLDTEPNTEEVRFSAKHLSTETRKLGDILTHIETYELSFEGSPELTTDHLIEGCGRIYKVREVLGRGDVQRPMRVVAEVTTRPRARV